MKQFGEYTRTKYKQRNGRRWKITETKRSLFFASPGKLRNPYRVARTYEKWDGEKWVFISGGATTYTH